MFSSRILIPVITVLIVGQSLGETIAVKDFDDGDLSGWLTCTVGNGRVSAESGDVQLQSPGLPYFAELAFDEAIAGDVSIRAQLNVTHGNVGVAVKRTRCGNTGDWLDLSPDGMLQYVDGGARVEFFDPVDVGLAAGGEADVFLQLDAFGDRVEGWAWPVDSPPPDSPQISVTLHPDQVDDGGYASVWSGGTVAVPGPAETLIRSIHVSDSPIPMDRPLALMPGDANQDLSFDQLDLVNVLQAAKYMTGEAAIWGEGDWDGGPGGEPGEPPLGNGLFDQFDIMAALGAGMYLTGPYAATASSGSVPAPVPEPSAVILAIVGLVGLLGMAQRRLRATNVSQGLC